MNHFLQVPPTTLAIRSDIFEYVLSRSRDWFTMDQFRHNLPSMDRNGSCNASGQHGVAAAIIMGVREIKVYLTDEDR
jgi:hypothetical protein